MSRLDGRRALVVGAGSGIGRAVLEAFHRQGAQVAALELDTSKCEGLERLGAGPVTRGDATEASANREAVEVAVDRFGGLDTLVCCVGLFDFYQGIRDLSTNTLGPAFDEIMRTNVLSHLLAVDAAEPHLRAARGTAILTASTSSFRPGRGGILYVASKFAVRGCVASLAHELAPDIRVNGVAPGGTLGTDLRGLRTLGLDDRSLGADPDRASEVAARSPLDVALDADDQAESFVFLASGAARGMTGRFLHPDGGAVIA